MRKLILSLVVISAICSNAQTSTPNYKKRPSLAVHFILNDFKTAEAIRKSSFGSVLNDKNWSRISQMTPGLGLQYLEGLCDHVDFASSLQISFLDYPFENKKSTGSDDMLLEADAAVNLKLLKDNYILVPYVTAGLGASMYKSYFSAYMPLGVGFQFNLGNSDAFLFTNAQYRVPVTDLASYHFNYSIGFASSIKAGKQ